MIDNNNGYGKNPPEEKKVQVKPLLTVGVGSDRRIYVMGPFAKDEEHKRLCLDALADAIKAVVNTKISRLIKPGQIPANTNPFLPGLRKFLGKN